jgi:hypothetical protein
MDGEWFSMESRGDEARKPVSKICCCKPAVCASPIAAAQSDDWQAKLPIILSLLLAMKSLSR